MKTLFFLLLLTPTAQAFVASSRTSRSWALQADITTSRSLDWIADGLAAQALKKDAVIGPQQVLIYDTSLRGTL